MPNWLLLVLPVAFIAATLVWHGVARAKESSETLLAEYQKLLAEARRKMAENRESEEDESTKARGHPQDTEPPE
jgi:hypothetical protein